MMENDAQEPISAVAAADNTETKKGGADYSAMTRRSLCFGAGAIAATLVLGGARYLPGTSVLRPPGGQDEAALFAGCIRCEKCYEVCPRSVIRPAHIEDGILTLRTPKLVFTDNYCDFCTESNDGMPLCVQACPTEALSLTDGVKAESAIIGKAVLDTDLCLAYNLEGCQFCSKACPYEAITLDAYNRPSIIDDRCNGCGACESVCVSLTEGSISIGATSRAITVKPVQA